MKTIFIKLFFLFFCFSILASPPKFTSTYEDWKNKENNFVEYLNQLDQARVIFIGSKVYSSDGKGTLPSVSEGQAYGLLLAYANDDQYLFDKFLRYILAACTKYGCVIVDKAGCHLRSFFLMPWLLDYKGEPFWYKPKKDSKESYFSSGSATDADIQIAWAINLANKRMKKGFWKSHYFQTYFGRADYEKILEMMTNEIRLYDINYDKIVYTPGSQWAEEGKKVFFAGYFTPQAFEALQESSLPKDQAFILDEEKNSKSYLVYLKNNSNKNLYLDLIKAEGKIYPNYQIVKTSQDNRYYVPPLMTAKIIYFPDNAHSQFHIKILNGLDHSSNHTIEYEFAAKNQAWHIKDIKKSDLITLSIIKDRAFITYTDSSFEKLNFSFYDVITNGALEIKKFQDTYNTGLVPNILYFSGKYPGLWEQTFSYDSVRYILWTAPYLAENANAKDFELLKSILDRMMKSVEPFIEKGKNGWTISAEGINVFTNKPNRGWEGIAYALNSPIYLYAYLNNNTSIMEKLGPEILSYSIASKQPSIFDPPNDSNAYFTATLILITKALLEGKLK